MQKKVFTYLKWIQVVAEVCIIIIFWLEIVVKFIVITNTRENSGSRLDCKHTFWSNFLPWVGRVHEGSILDLVMDVLILIEWECSTEADVDNDANTPHV